MDDTSPRRRASDSDDGVHWEITRQHANEISSIRESQARNEEVLSSVLRGQEEMRGALDTLIHRVSEPPPTTDLAKLIGTTVTVLTMFGALVYAYLSPIAERQDKNELHIETLYEMSRENAYGRGVQDAEIKAMKEHLNDWANKE